jgi:hypothetical protein
MVVNDQVGAVDRLAPAHSPIRAARLCRLAPASSIHRTGQAIEVNRPYLAVSRHA